MLTHFNTKLIECDISQFNSEMELKIKIKIMWWKIIVPRTISMILVTAINPQKPVLKTAPFHTDPIPTPPYLALQQQNSFMLTLTNFKV